RRNSALGPYRVLDLADEKGVLCTKLLADLGADVIKVEPPGGDPTRQTGPFYHDQRDPEKSLFWMAFNTSKRSITLDLTAPEGQALFRRLVRTADILVESLPPGYLDRLGLGYPALRELNPRFIVTSITPFGQTGPYKDYQASDIVALAMGGLMDTLGDPDRPPVRVTVSQAYAQAGVQGAIGTLMALLYRMRTGKGQHVDLSMQAAIPITAPLAHCFWEFQRTLRRRTGNQISLEGRRERWVYPCKDGFVICQVGVSGAGNGRVLLEWLSSHGMAEDLTAAEMERLGRHSKATEMSQEEIQHREEVAARFFLTRTRRELYQEAQRWGVQLMPIETVEELLESPQLRARGSWTPLEHPELHTTITYPGAPFKMSETPYRLWHRAPLLGEHTEEVLRELDHQREPSHNGPAHPEAISKPLEDIKVLEFTWQSVGPLVGRWLALFGAEVIQVESSRRMCRHRITPPFKDGIEDINRAGWYAQPNPQKLGVSLNLEHPEAVELARRRALRSDVMIDNFSSHQVLAKRGLGYDALAREKPGLIAISLCMAGQTGPDRGLRGYGPLLMGLSGIASLIGWPDRTPMGITSAYTDYFVPHLGAVAVLAALEYRRRTGRGQYIDLSQLEAANHALHEALLDYTVNGRVLQRMGNRLPYVPAAPHGVYRCQGDDRWCAIAVFNQEQWRALCLALGDPPWARAERFATLERRVQHADELDPLVERWTRRHSPEEVMRRLQKAGVPAGVVQSAQDILDRDPQLKHRGYHWKLHHPVMGWYREQGPSFILSESPGGITQPVHLFGEHNRYVYTEALGLSEEEFTGLAAEGAFD
ncbi:MAG: CaiB/BaiF CoA transferase family protein, partial [Dehalococcoidia bacterium]